jgi:hypothetical protein
MIGWSRHQLDLIFGLFDKTHTIRNVAEFRKFGWRGISPNPRVAVNGIDRERFGT